MHIADHARNAQCLLDLVDMLETNALEGQPAPSVVDGLFQDGRPIVFVVDVFPCHELEIEQRKIVNKLIDSLFFRFSQSIVGADEVALFKFGEDFRQGAAIVLSQGLDDFRPSHACLFGAQCGHHIDIGLRVAEQRRIKRIELAAHFAVSVEKHTVDVLCPRKFLLQKIPVKRNAAHDHVCLKDVASIHAQPLRLGVQLALMQGERLNVNLARQPVVQSTVIHHYIVDNP